MKIEVEVRETDKQTIAVLNWAFSLLLKFLREFHPEIIEEFHEYLQKSRED